MYGRALSRFGLAGHDIIVIGASAGGVQPARTLLSLLPAEIPAAVFIVLHRPPSLFVDPLPAVLDSNSDLKITPAVDGERFEYGHVYLSTGDSHLLVERGMIRLEESPKESHSRPSIDALFRSAALAYGRRVVGVILSGAASDGTVGLWQVRKHGGVTITQDPLEAPFPSMPKNAMENVPVHYCLQVSEIARKLVELAEEQPLPAPVSGPNNARLVIVEDERIVAMNLEHRLRELGYEIIGSFSSAEECLDMVRRTMPDIVLMDIKLSGKMKGTEAARILWEQYQIPVVYLTAYADNRTLDEAKLSMPYGYVVKPFRPEQIHAAIQLALDRFEREMHTA
jgi:chemotaxis response regulator CheB